jgi:hypothetical protein
LSVNRLDIEWTNGRQIPLPERWPNVSAQQALVVSVDLIAKPRLSCSFEPAIKELVQRDRDSFDSAAQVTLAQHLIEVYLGVPGGAANGMVVIQPLAGLAVVAQENAHQPPTSSPPHNLSGLSGQTNSLPKIWHTTGTPAPATTLQLQSLGEVGTEWQSVSFGETLCNKQSQTPND